MKETWYQKLKRTWKEKWTSFFAFCKENKDGIGLISSVLSCVGLLGVIIFNKTRDKDSFDVVVFNPETHGTEVHKVRSTVVKTGQYPINYLDKED